MNRYIRSYAVAHFGKTLLWIFFNTFFLYFAIFGLGLEPLEASALVFVFAAADAVFDIPASFLLHRAERLGGSLFAWVLIAAPVCGFALAFSFWLADTLNPLWISISFAAGILFRLAFTFVDVPLNGSVGRADFSSRGRNIVVAGRSLAGTAAKLVLVATTAIYLERDGQVDPERLFFAAAAFGLVAPLFIVPAFQRVDDQARAIEKRTPTGQSDPSLPRLRKYVTTNLVMLVCANVAWLALASQFGHAIIFLSETNLQFGLSFSASTLVITLVSAVTIWPWMMLASRIDKVPAALICLLSLSLVLIAFPLTVGDRAFLVLGLVAYASCFHVNAFIWSILPDLVDEVGARVGPSAHALVVGLFAAIGKLMIGLAGLLSGWLLDRSGFPNFPNVEKYIGELIFASILGVILTALFLCFVKTSHSKHQTLMQETIAGPQN